MDGLVGYDSDDSEKGLKSTDSAIARDKGSDQNSSSKLEAEWEAFENLIGDPGGTNEGETCAKVPSELPTSIPLPKGLNDATETSSDKQSKKEEKPKSSKQDESSDESGSESEGSSESGSEESSDDEEDEEESDEEETSSEEDSSEEEESSSEEEEEEPVKKKRARKSSESKKRKSSESKDLQSSNSDKKSKVEIDNGKHKHKSPSRSPKHKPNHSSDHRSKRSPERSKDKEKDAHRRRRSRSRSRHRHRRSKSREKDRKSRDLGHGSGRSHKDDGRRRKKDGHRRSRSRSRDRRKRSRSRQRSRSKDRFHQDRKSSRSSRKYRDRRRSPSPSRRGRRDKRGRGYRRSRSRSRSPKKLTFKEHLKQQLLEVQKCATEGKLNMEQAQLVTQMLANAGEKPSNLPLNSDNPIMAMMSAQSKGQVTPQQALLQTMAAMHQKAQELTGVAVPKYYNPAAVNPLKYAEQVQKRKLLWGKNKKPEGGEASEAAPSAPSTSNVELPTPEIASTSGVGNKTAAVWKSTSFGQTNVDEKFRKLMGIKQGEGDEKDSKELTEEQRKKQEELFSQLDKEYTMARMTTHTHRGIGLGFGSQGMPQ